MRKCLKHLALIAVTVVFLKWLFSWLFQRVNDSKPCVFDPAELQEIANIGADLPIEQRWDAIHKELLLRHPGKIAPEIRWTFNSAGKDRKSVV